MNRRLCSFNMRKWFRLSRHRLLLWRFLEGIFLLIEPLARRVGFRLAFQVYEIRSTKKDLRFESVRLVKKDTKEIGILIQGPVSDIPFLNETISTYKRNFLNSSIVLSTWKNNPQISQVLEVEGLTIVENEIPSNKGTANLNLQTLSTISGINTLIEQGTQYILKTRTDQVLFSNRALDLLLNRLKTSPHSNFQRIVTTDFNSFLFRPYSPNDQLLFGRSGVLLDFWSAYWKRKSEVSKFQEDWAEKLLVRCYLQELEIPFKNTLLQSLEIYRDLYSFIDCEDLDLYWKKGTHRTLRSRFPQQTFPSEHSFVRFTDWIQMQENLDFFISAYNEI